MRSARNDTEHPAGQYIYKDVQHEINALAYSAKSGTAQKLGDIIDRVWKAENLTRPVVVVNEIEEAFRRGKAEGYTQGYYEGIIDERNKWLNNTYHQTKD